MEISAAIHQNWFAIFTFNWCRRLCVIHMYCDIQQVMLKLTSSAQNLWNWKMAKWAATKFNKHDKCDYKIRYIISGTSDAVADLLHLIELQPCKQVRFNLIMKFAPTLLGVNYTYIWIGKPPLKISYTQIRYSKKTIMLKGSQVIRNQQLVRVLVLLCSCSNLHWAQKAARNDTKLIKRSGA